MGSSTAFDVHVLLAAAVVIAGVRILGWPLAKLGEPQVMAEIVGGVLIGPSLLGVISPAAEHYLFPTSVTRSLVSLAQIGLVVFMFCVGLEIDNTSFQRNRKRVLVVSQISIGVPMVLGAGLSLLVFPEFGGHRPELSFCLFFAAAMSITAFPVLARLLEETGLRDTPVGSLCLTCAAANDLVAWFTLAIVTAVATSSGPMGVVRSLSEAAGYLLVMAMVVRPIVARLAHDGKFPLWLALSLVFISAYVSNVIGLDTIFGAFIAGLVMPRDRQWREEITQPVSYVISNLLLPLFFAQVGLTTRLSLIGSTSGWLVLLAVVVVATIGKFGGSTIAARVTGDGWKDAVVVGVLMNTRGLTEIVFLSVGLNLGVISARLFTIMVVMATVTTLAAAPFLRAVGYHPALPDGEPDVRDRLSVGIAEAG